MHRALIFALCPAFAAAQAIYIQPDNTIGATIVTNGVFTHIIGPDNRVTGTIVQTQPSNNVYIPVPVAPPPPPPAPAPEPRPEIFDWNKQFPAVR